MRSLCWCIYLVLTAQLNFPFLFIYLNQKKLFQSAFQGLQRRLRPSVIDTVQWVTNSINYISNYNIYLVSKIKIFFNMHAMNIPPSTRIYKCNYFQLMIWIMTQYFPQMLKTKYLTSNVFFGWTRRSEGVTHRVVAGTPFGPQEQTQV